MNEPVEDPYRAAAPPSRATTSWVVVYRWGMRDTLGVLALAFFMSLVALFMILGGLDLLVGAIRLGAAAQGLGAVAFVATAIVMLAMSVRFARSRLGGARRT